MSPCVSGIIELRPLADDDRAGADDENVFDVGSLGYGDVIQ